jgi:hypothetical protein
MGAFKGMFYATLLSIPIWAIVIMTVIGWYKIIF